MADNSSVTVWIIWAQCWVHTCWVTVITKKETIIEQFQFWFFLFNQQIIIKDLNSWIDIMNLPVTTNCCCCCCRSSKVDSVSMGSWYNMCILWNMYSCWNIRWNWWCSMQQRVVTNWKTYNLIEIRKNETKCVRRVKSLIAFSNSLWIQYWPGHNAGFNPAGNCGAEQATAIIATKQIYVYDKKISLFYHSINEWMLKKNLELEPTYHFWEHIGLLCVISILFQQEIFEFKQKTIFHTNGYETWDLHTTAKWTLIEISFGSAA